MKGFLTVLSAAALLSVSCSKQKADLILYNGQVYTVNGAFDTVQAFAVKDGKILATGNTEEIRKSYTAPEEIDALGKPVYPGFIDAHAHFFGYGQSLQDADLREAKSWEEVCGRLTEFAKTHPDGWLTGNGWDQNDWPGKQFPDKTKLDQLFPERPVFLTRIDGHAAIANQKALDAAGLTKSYVLTGGEIVSKNGKLTGLLIDNATSLVENKIQAPSPQQMEKILMDAQQNCFAAGLTTIDDCGSNYELVNLIEKMQAGHKLKMRMYVMLSDHQPNYDYLFKRGAIKTERLNVRAFKVMGDGALGSRGACLLHPYHDMPDKSGFLLSNPEHFEAIAKKLAEKNFQMCTHAIGDSANRTILKIYNKVLGGKNDKRWRIEHAQVIAPEDFDLFGKANIIPSVQPTHATSDMYWAADRLGPERIKGAYAFKQLLKQNGWIPLGTDFPVEQINPMLTFYAATIRKDASNYPEGGFQKENGLSKEETLRGMTIWAAKANFEEQEKGSIETGKFADFVILDQDLLKASPAQILNTQVLKTYINGEKVYEKK
ncbi:amidohydrolase [Pedobacter heparinus]|uniref:Amidohydrolase 3 n=1 Tax=Pedobacter heparinus (strain ATCC 13125 / DSM 2366 / CIP 104194 / JCM 7457 / NBRC 12017 / NCIMB 9290 / NRRL B-14731 / HIM 762-3) TaxID=485917 RepID=C6Y009_PEDHD|nr:amidohydrolase [Pedobacter heparinus]ACU02704.1 Amidohydrolase 3 [Pedobacter heparinus DSM 2366]